MISTGAGSEPVTLADVERGRVEHVERAGLADRHQPRAVGAEREPADTGSRRSGGGRKYTKTNCRGSRGGTNQTRHEIFPLRN